MGFIVLRPYVLLHIITCCIFWSSPSTSIHRYLTWLTNKSGFFSQFLQLKIMMLFSKNTKRIAAAPSMYNSHFNGTYVSLCDYLVLPPEATCMSHINYQVNRQSCYRNLNHTVMLSDAVKLYCYDGPVPLLGAYVSYITYAHTYNCCIAHKMLCIALIFNSFTSAMKILIISYIQDLQDWRNTVQYHRLDVVNDHVTFYGHSFRSFYFTIVVNLKKNADESNV
jgi:hypothetical protein